MGKLIKRPVKSQILGSSSFFKTRSNNPFGFKTTSDIFALPSGTVSTIYTVATGGVITQVGDYKVHTFNSSSNFVVSTLGTDATVEYLVVAGGGGGGGGTGGGGGAGGLKTSTGLSIAVQSYPVVIGSGGAGLVQAHGISGVNSSFNAITSTGGGGASSNYQGNAGFSGGSGGGGCYSGSLGGVGTLGQGNAGGNGAIAYPYGGGGGGGAGAAGSNGASLGTSIGGIGLASSINGTSTYYAGGGSGGSYLATINAPLGGGGNGNGSNGATNTGGGGGGQKSDGATISGNGGSGIVIIKYKSPTPITFTTATGGIITTSGNYKIHTFNSTDNFVVTNAGTDNTVEYLVVSGGGGGSGPCAAVGNGGGGAGGYLTNTGLSITAQTYPVVVGSGGNGGTGGSSGNNGVSSSFNSIAPYGGGKGQGFGTINTVTLNGSGGGGAKDSTPFTPLGTVGQGKNGGWSESFGGGGGGGAGTAGSTASSWTGEPGGNGLSSSISGNLVTYAGGGGGGSYNLAGGNGGTGGAGKGGSSTAVATLPTSATVNTGSGGGGSGAYTIGGPVGGNGGSGIVIIKYKFQDVPYLTESQAYFTQVNANGGSLTESEKTYINTFIGALGTDFAEFDRLWIHGLSNSVAARTSLANPTSTMITAVNSPTFTASQGYTGNGTSSYLNTNYNPTTNGVKYTLNSASLYVYSRTDLNGTKLDIGHANATSYSTLDIRDGGSFYRSINQVGLASAVVVANSLGLFSGVRLASQNVRSFKNGVLLINNSTDSSTLINNNMYVSALNNNGTAAFYSQRQLSVSGIGSGVINQSTFYTALQELGTSIGWAV